MKKINILYGIFMMFTLLCNSQSFSYGLVGGLNTSNTEFEINHNGSISGTVYDNRFSFYLGGNIEFPIQLADIELLLNIELIYSEQGNSFIGYEEYLYTYELNQLNLPIRIKSKLYEKFYFGLGGYIGYILNVKDEFYGDDRDVYGLDFGLLSSIEYNLFGNLNIEMKYLFGLSDVLNREYNNGDYKHDIYNRVFQIGLNYKI